MLITTEFESAFSKYNDTMITKRYLLVSAFRDYDSHSPLIKHYKITPRHLKMPKNTQNICISALPVYVNEMNNKIQNFHKILKDKT